MNSDPPTGRDGVDVIIDDLDEAPFVEGRSFVIGPELGPIPANHELGEALGS